MISKFWSQSGKRLRQIIHTEHGLVLAEALVTMAIAGLVITVFLFSMSTTSKAVMVSQRLVTAESLAKSQMESLRSQPYDDDEAHNPPQYVALPAGDEGYTIVITTERLDPKDDGLTNDDGLQKFTVVVNYDGTEAFKLEDYRMKR